MSVVAMRRVLLTLAAVGVLLLLSSMVAGAATRGRARPVASLARSRSPRPRTSPTPASRELLKQAFRLGRSFRAPSPRSLPFGTRRPPGVAGTPCEIAAGACATPPCAEFTATGAPAVLENLNAAIGRAGTPACTARSTSRTVYVAAAG